MEIRKRTVALVIVACAALAAGCTHHTRRRVRFNASEHEPYAKRGTAKVVGQAFQRTTTGEVKFAAGHDVLAVPATAYFKEWIDWIKWVGEEPSEQAETFTIDPADSRVDRYIKRTVADAEGRFEIEGLPPGRYFICSNVSWLYLYYNGLETQWRTTGSWVFARLYENQSRLVDVVTLRAGETVRVVLPPGKLEPSKLPTSLPRPR